MLHQRIVKPKIVLKKNINHWNLTSTVSVVLHKKKSWWNVHNNTIFFIMLGYMRKISLSWAQNEKHLGPFNNYCKISSWLTDWSEQKLRTCTLFAIHAIFPTKQAYVHSHAACSSNKIMTNTWKGTNSTRIFQVFFSTVESLSNLLYHWLCCHPSCWLHIGNWW